MSLAGLELGARVGERVEHASDLLGGVILIAVGVAIALGVRRSCREALVAR